jgi:hypothetical protein
VVGPATGLAVAQIQSVSPVQEALRHMLLEQISPLAQSAFCEQARLQVFPPQVQSVSVGHDGLRQTPW